MSFLFVEKNDNSTLLCFFLLILSFTKEFIFFYEKLLVMLVNEMEEKWMTCEEVLNELNQLLVLLYRNEGQIQAFFKQEAADLQNLFNQKLKEINRK